VSPKAALFRTQSLTSGLAERSGSSRPSTIPRDPYPTPAVADAALPGSRKRRVPAAPPEQRQPSTREPDARAWKQGASGGRPARRPPDAPVGSAHAAVHLRRARRDPHHRPAADGAPPR